jgi:hypothetical protein
MASVFNELHLRIQADLKIKWPVVSQDQIMWILFIDHLLCKIPTISEKDLIVFISGPSHLSDINNCGQSSVILYLVFYIYIYTLTCFDQIWSSSEGAFYISTIWKLLIDITTFLFHFYLEYLCIYTPRFFYKIAKLYTCCLLLLIYKKLQP